MKQINMNEESNDSQNNLIEESSSSKQKILKTDENTVKIESQDISGNIKASDLISKNLNFLNDEEQDKSSQHKEKNKKFSFFEQNMKYKLKINIDYSDLDKQKAEISPKMLFKKRKLEAFDNLNNNTDDKNNNLNNPNNQSSTSNNQKINAKIKNCFEKYLDFVHASYFTTFENINTTTSNLNISNQNSNQNINYDTSSIPVEESNDDFPKSMSNFRFSSLDLLINPLRQKFPFESWSPYEVALFECCICKYNKSFDMFCRIVYKYV